MVLDELHIGGFSVPDAENRVNEWVTELKKSRKGHMANEI